MTIELEAGKFYFDGETQQNTEFVELTKDRFIAIMKSSEGQLYYQSTDNLYPMKDLITDAVRKDLLDRSTLGIKKYGTTLDRNSSDLRYWLNHAYEEALDHAQYLKRAIMEIDSKNGN